MLTFSNPKKIQKYYGPDSYQSGEMSNSEKWGKYVVDSLDQSFRMAKSAKIEELKISVNNFRKYLEMNSLQESYEWANNEIVKDSKEHKELISQFVRLGCRVGHNDI